MEKLPVKDIFKGPGSWFTGDVYGSPIYSGTDPSRMSATLVRFTPGARTHWHRHALGQCLHGTAGDTVWTPGGEDHWHGALEGRMMCHLAMLERDGETDPTTWLEPVDDAEYARAMSIAAVQLTD